MICPKCKSEIENTSTVCPVCRRNFGEVKQGKIKVPHKKGHTRRVLGTVLAVFLACALAILLFWENLVGYALRSFGEPDQYLSYVEGKAIRKGSEGLLRLYGSAMEEQGGDLGVISGVKLLFGDRSAEILNSALGDYGEEITDWLNQVKIVQDLDQKDGNLQQKLTLYVDNKAVFEFLSLTDAEGNSYLALPGIREGYGKIEHNPHRKLTDALPEEKVLESVLKRYVELVLSEMKGADLGTGTYYFPEGASVTCHTVRLEMTKGRLQEILISVLDTAETDPECKEIYDQIIRYAEETELLEKDTAAKWSDAVRALREDVQAMFLAEEADQVLFVLTDYIDSKNRILGREISFDDTKASVRFFSNEKYHDFALSSEQFSLAFFGTTEKRTTVMEGSLAVEEKEYLAFRWENEETQTRFEVSLADDLKDLLAEASGSEELPAYLDLSLVAKFRYEKGFTEAEYRLSDREETLFSVTVNTQLGAPEEVTLPAASEVEVLEKDEFLTRSDLEEILRKLTESGFPSELLMGT